MKIVKTNTFYIGITTLPFDFKLDYAYSWCYRIPETYVSGFV